MGIPRNKLKGESASSQTASRGQLMGHRVLAILNEGASSTTSLVADPVDGSLRALKHAVRESSSDDALLERLTDEHEIVRRFDHAGVRRVHRLQRIRSRFRLREVGLFQQYVDGPTLDRWTPTNGDAILEVMEQLGRAVSHVHDQGYVHGSIRPRHVVVDHQDFPVLIGFGDATEDGVAAEVGSGNPGYSSPEQFLGGVLTARSDIFGFAATMAAMIFRNRLAMADARELCAADWIDLHAHWIEELDRRTTSVGLVRLMEQCLQPDPTRRPIGMPEVVHRLGEIRRLGDFGGVVARGRAA
ncbi:MAG: protein kinase [Phycisphaeraceae bacterium]|nr:protein kinase [Phycisphaeraceae bacterium]